MKRQARPLVDDVDLDDMQALLGSGFGWLRHSEYLLLDVIDASRAREWLARVRVNVPSVASLGPRRQHDAARPKCREAWSIAFTYRGLVRLGTVQDDDAPFPSIFRTGQAAPLRRTLLRDPNPQVPWAWGDVQGEDAANDSGAVSILVVRLHAGSEGPAPALSDEVLAASGLHLVRRVRGSASSFRKVPRRSGSGHATHLYEPFGFRDGLSQPVLQGLRPEPADDASEATSDEIDDDVVPLGEFVLGHANGFREKAHCPDVLARRVAGAPAAAPPDKPAPFGRNGSYLAVRQIFQHVAAFNRFEAAQPPDGNASVVEKMVGRRKNGAPLQTCPDVPAGKEPLRYRMNDSRGLQCPVGAHVRRANPRDALAESATSGVASAKLHRLLRRGRPYAACADAATCPQREACGSTEECASCPTGVMFIAVVADLARQFEFVQRLWVGNPNFDTLQESVDPIVGHAASHRFVMPGTPLGQRVAPVPEFTRVEGGGYFFLPSLTALRRLADGGLTSG